MTKALARTLPSEVAFLMEAMNCDNDDTARILMRQGLSAVNSKSYFSDAKWEDSDLDSFLLLIRGIHPQDTVECVLAMQFVTLHLKGINELTDSSDAAKSHGMMMIRLSHQAIETLQRYRGKSQQINVTYNVAPQGNAVMNTLIAQAGGQPKKGS